MTTGRRLARVVAGEQVWSDQHGSPGRSSAVLFLGPAGPVVIDTGGPGYRPLWTAWLASEGLTRHDVSAVLITHAHWDHVGAAPWFPEADAFMSAEELSWCGDPGDDAFVDTATVHALARSERLHTVADGEEVYGVRAVATPGHTPGHLSYLVRHDGGAVIVVGDAIKNSTELAGGEFAMTMSPADSHSSRARLIRSAEEHDALLLLGHGGLHDARAQQPALSPAPLTQGAKTRSAP